MESTADKLNFKDYYKTLAEQQGVLKRMICHRLEISYKTFYNKTNNDSWTTIEREEVNKIVEEFNQELGKIETPCL